MYAFCMKFLDNNNKNVSHRITSYQSNYLLTNHMNFLALPLLPSAEFNNQMANITIQLATRVLNMNFG